MAAACPEPSCDLSIVVPVFNEEGSLQELYDQIVAGCDDAGRTFELIFVDDGSTDQSAAVCDGLADADPRVSVIHFRRNFGKSLALAAGFAEVRGEVVFTMDADLQDDPAMIPAFLARIDAGADLVSGFKKNRHDPLEKRLPSKLFNGLVRALSGVQLNDFNCGFKAYRIECVRELRVYGGLHRFLPVLAGARGFRIEELVVNHRPRTHGVSKFGIGRYFDGFVDLMTVVLVTRYRTSPARFFAIPGVAMGTLGISLLLYLTGLWLSGEGIGHRPLLTLGVLLTMTSALLVSVGLLAELLVRSTLRTEEIYSVRRIHRGSASAEDQDKPMKTGDSEPAEHAADAPAEPRVRVV